MHPSDDIDTPSVVVERAKRVHIKDKKIESHDDLRHHRLARQAKIAEVSDDEDWRDYIDR
jgi:hypothetical protein